MTAGQISLLTHQRSIASIVDDPSAEATLRARLSQAQDARRFASDRLGLPRNRSYTTYVDLHRPYVVWNVFAAPEFSVDPVTHCFPFAGCVAYLGYFDKARAEAESARQAAHGDDVAVEGAAAYSTLGWFADPVLSSMLRWSDDELDGVIFHELAHQLVYVKNDSAFNESFATFVQEQGVREWRADRGLPPPNPDERRRDEAFTTLVLALREHLRAIYAEPLAEDGKRQAKRVAIEEFRDRYRRLRDTEWGGDARYDRWVDAPINNARLVPFGLYERWLGAFARLFIESGSDWAAFYAQVRALARLDPAARDGRLQALLDTPCGRAQLFRSPETLSPYSPRGPHFVGNGSASDGS